MAFDEGPPRRRDLAAGAAQPAGSAQLRAEPVLTAHTAGQLLALAQHLGGTVRPLLDRLDLPDRVYGSTTAGPALAWAHQSSISDVQDILDRLVGVLEGDSDRLYRIAFAVQEADRSAAARLAGARTEPAPWAGPGRTERP